jgi:hypothetical protein
LGEDLTRIEMTVSSEVSPDLAEGLSSGRLDIAFMRAEPNHPDLDYVTIAREHFVVVLPSDHRLTEPDKVDVRQLAEEVFIGGSDIAGPMRRAIEAYLAANDLDIEPAHRVHNLTLAMLLIASTRGVALLPAYAVNWLPWMPFCLSSGQTGLVYLASALADQGEHLASDVAFQASDDLQLGMALSDAPRHVGLGSRIGQEPSDGDDVQGAVRCSITASIEAMAGRLAGRSRNWAHTTKSREAALRMETLRVVASCQ